MVIHTCPTCNKNFNKKSNYDRHIENKKKPCMQINNIIPPISSDNINKNIIIEEDTIDLILEKTIINDINNISKKNSCIYCEKIFTRTDNLQRHQNGSCKSKVNHDDLENLKKKMNMILENYEDLRNENVNFKKEIIDLKNENVNLKKEIADLKNNTVSSDKNSQKSKKHTKRENIPQILRYSVWKKYFNKNNEGKCICCKNNTISITNFDCGHITSNKDGGKIHIDNLRPICKTCNSSMGTTNMDVFIKKYGF